MAKSPSHRFGQIIGEVLEAAVAPSLAKFAKQAGLYLDRKGKRAARSGKKVTWQDLYGNRHDLDVVLERNGTDEKLGVPVAFIEIAWRSYTKHSRNKAQEIQGAIQPLLATHRSAAPFSGVVLGGAFTGGAVKQLKSLGFSVVHFEVGQVVEAFRTAGIDAAFDEATPNKDLAKKVAAWKSLPASRQATVAEALARIGKAQFAAFLVW